MRDEEKGVSEASTNIERVKEEWLVGNSVVAFVGALLMAQTWGPSEARNEIPLLGVAVPVTPQIVVLVIVAYLATLSFTLAVASAVPPLRTWAVNQARPYSSLLELLMWMAFLISLVSALAEIPSDQWWAQALWLGGTVLPLFRSGRLLFLLGRMALKRLIPSATGLGNLLFRLFSRTWDRLVASR